MTLNIVHVGSDGADGDAERRTARLINSFGAAARHTVLGAVPNIRDAIASGIDAAFPADAPSLTGRASVARYQAIARYLRRFDLVLTYGWGAIDAVMARRIFGGPPLVHHEDGFAADEAIRLRTERNLLRRIALPGASALVVPSLTLMEIARHSWKQPATRVKRIPNGVEIARYAAPPVADAVPGFERRKGDLVIGSVAPLQEVKNLPRLVRAFAKLPAPARLVIVGEGPERDAILAEAARLGVADRVHLPGRLGEPHRYIGLFDIFALSSRSEQQPMAVIEAMAAGLPIIAPDVGDIRRMVSQANATYIRKREAELPLGHALQSLAASPPLRRDIGRANRLRAQADFDEAGMIERYAALYAEVAARPGSLTPR